MRCTGRRLAKGGHATGVLSLNFDLKAAGRCTSQVCIHQCRAGTCSQTCAPPCALQQGASTPASKHQSRYTAVGEHSADIVKTLCNALAAAKRTAPSAAIESRLRSSAASSLCGIHALLSTFVKTKRRRETPM